MTSPINHCKDCVDLLGDYIEDTLPSEQKKALEEHLSLCPPCITFVRTYKATRSLCRKTLEREMPVELMSSLQNFLGQHVPGFACTKPDTASRQETAAADRAPKKV